MIEIYNLNPICLFKYTALEKIPLDLFEPRSLVSTIMFPVLCDWIAVLSWREIPSSPWSYLSGVRDN